LDISKLKIKFCSFFPTFACGTRQHLLPHCAVCSLNEMLQARTCWQQLTVLGIAFCQLTSSFISSNNNWFQLLAFVSAKVC